MTKEKPKKKKKKPSPVKDYLAYVALRIVIFILHLFPIETNLRTARFLGRLLWKHYHRGRKRAIENLHASYPDKDRDWIEHTGRRRFEHLAMLAIDIMFVPTLVKAENWRKYSRYKNVERLKWMLKEGRGMLLATAHYGSFEMTGYVLSMFGFDIYSVARPLDNKYISRYIYGIREKHGQKIVDKKGGAKLMEQISSSGTALGFTADQDAGRKGVFVDFFGRKASAYKSIGLLAITNNIPIAVGYARRIDDRFFFEIGVQRIIFPEEWADKDDPLTWVTAAYTSAIEEFIRVDPEQYWWLHRRWKHRPKEERQQAKQ
jgi:KDO2-lipid IV(A) lauroyltransferase